MMYLLLLLQITVLCQIFRHSNWINGIKYYINDNLQFITYAFENKSKYKKSVNCFNAENKLRSQNLDSMMVLYN